MRLAGIAVLALLGLAAPLVAQQPRAVTLWASGRIARFDPSAHLLVIRQGTHEMTFTVGSDARVLRGHEPQPESPAELRQVIGRDARINYVTISGIRVARRVLLVFVDR